MSSSPAQSGPTEFNFNHGLPASLPSYMASISSTRHVTDARFHQREVFARLVMNLNALRKLRRLRQQLTQYTMDNTPGKFIGSVTEDYNGRICKLLPALA